MMQGTLIDVLEIVIQYISIYIKYTVLYSNYLKHTNYKIKIHMQN
jgi:hypothetical protein